MPDVEVRKGQGTFPLSKQVFAERFRRLFNDPAFDAQLGEIEALIDIAWEGYCKARKSPRTQRAGSGFKDPNYEISIEWLRTRASIRQAQAAHDDANNPNRVLLVCASPRNDKSCPGEMSKTHRMTELAQAVFTEAGTVVDRLDLSELTSEWGKVIYPCKGCVSTAMPLCHWPCSCYPNFSLGQVHDWMAELYPRWVAAHGILIVTPIHWYQAPSVLKLMMDRLVCADGGNPDISATHGKHADEAKALELNGWDYPKHLAGRSYGIVVHGDAAGAGTLRRDLMDWFNDMGLVQAGTSACIDRYVDYYGPYATSHQAFDKDTAIQEEVRNAARALTQSIIEMREGRSTPDAELRSPRPK